jgi:hypothetical protein
VDLCDEPADPEPQIRSVPPPRSGCTIDISLEEDDDADTVCLPLNDGDDDCHDSDEVEVLGFYNSSCVTAPNVLPAVTGDSGSLPDTSAAASEQPPTSHGGTESAACSSSAVVNAVVPLNSNAAGSGQVDYNHQLLAAPSIVNGETTLQCAVPQDVTDLSVSVCADNATGSTVPDTYAESAILSGISHGRGGRDGFSSPHIFDLASDMEEGASDDRIGGSNRAHRGRAVSAVEGERSGVGGWWCQ